ncbi:hypothetical protein ACROYT_G019556 [Oculina patagonica]
MAFLASRGDVIHFSMQNGANNGEKQIGIDVFHFSKSCRSFRRTAKKSLPLGITGSKLEFVSVKCLVNSNTGMYQMCLLLRQPQRKPSSTEEFHVLLLEDYDSVFVLGSFEIQASKTSSIEFHFIDGPSICWSLQGLLYFARYNSALEKFTTDSITVDNSMNKQPGVDFNLLWCGLLKNQMVAMGSKSEMTDSASCLTRWTCVNHHQNDVQEIPLVPNVYVPITTCCFVREPFQAVKSGRINSSFDGLDVYIATNRGQLLNFVNGCHKYCWQLPFSDPCRIWMLELAPNEVMVMVASQAKKVCAVDCTKNKVLKEWNDVESVLIDDFQETGTEQVLFLPYNLIISESGEFSDFSLIDFAKGMTSVEGNQGSFSGKSQPVTDSLQKTARALRTRLQARASSLHEAKMECHEKLKMVEHCCKVLKDLTCSYHPSNEEKETKFSGLYCLLEGDLGEVKQNTSKPVRSVAKSVLTVKEIWQRIVYDQWIVGVDLENTGESAVSDLTLGLVSCQPEDTSYSSKSVFCGDNNRHCKQLQKSTPSQSQMSPSSKRKRLDSAKTTENSKQLLPGNQTRLTAVTSLPRFTCLDSCLMSVVVTWTSHHGDGSLDCCSTHCGHITLFTKQIMDGSVRVNSSLDHKSIQQDIAALRSVSVETELVLQSSISRPHYITALLKSSMGKVPIVHVGTGDHEDIFGQLLSVLHDNGPLGGAGIVLKDELKEGKIILITRNKNQVYLLLHTLRQVLPDDVQILADPVLDLTSVKNSLRALNQEITNFQQNLHKLTQTPSKSHASLYTVDGRGLERRGEDSDGIKALREGFDRKREREVLGKEESSNELSDFTKLWHDFVEDQITTDIAVAET